MSIDKFHDSTWDKFFDFIHEADEAMTDEEVSDALRERGIDLNLARERVLKAVREARLKRERDERAAKWKR